MSTLLSRASKKLTHSHAQCPIWPVQSSKPIFRPWGPTTQRNFHLSSIGDLVTSTADGISFIHHTGLPWYFTIPMVAVGINFSFRLPIQYYTRRLVVKRNELTPLVKAWNLRHARSVPLLRPDEKAARIRSLRISSLTERSRSRIYKVWGVQRWKSLAPFMSMVPFIIVSESLRRLCGAPLGWISHSLGLAKVDGSLSAASSFDPCLVDGGCLWFTDLTAMDPYFALPILCSVLLARNSWGRLSKEQLQALLTINPDVPQSPIVRIRTAVGRTLLLIPLFPIFFADLPSAIFLYWASTFALNDGNEAILEKLVPKKPSRLMTPSHQEPMVLPYLRGNITKVPKQ